MTWATILLAVAGYALLAARRGKWRGSTLTAAWWWSVASWTAIVVAQVATAFAARGDAAWLLALRWIAAVGACCPLVAVLGAKRPQDKPWQFIVLSLWAVLSLPAAQTLLVRPDRPPAPHAAMGLFLAAIALAGIWNGFRTRYFPAALALGAGQTLLLAEHFFPVGRQPAVAQLGRGCFVLGWAAATIADRKVAAAATEIDAAWIEFRDGYGGFWAARVIDRMNASGRLQGWNVELAWNGFREVEGEAASSRETTEPLSITRPAVQTLVNLLRRFVSPEWIAARLEPDLE
jgi:hypothetical protein